MALSREERLASGTEALDASLLSPSGTAFGPSGATGSSCCFESTNEESLLNDSAKIDSCANAKPFPTPCSGGGNIHPSPPVSSSSPLLSSTTADSTTSPIQLPCLGFPGDAGPTLSCTDGLGSTPNLPCSSRQPLASPTSASSSSQASRLRSSGPGITRGEAATGDVRIGFGR